MVKKPESNNMTKCSQCDKVAVVSFGGLPLCVDHHLKMQQANYLQSSLLAANFNLLADQLDKGTGYLVRHSRIEIPRPPFIGDNLTLHNINVSGVTIGSINTGIIHNLDASITVMQSQDKPELADAIKELTEAIIKTNEIDETAKNEIAQQLEFLTAQVTARSQDKSVGLVKGVMLGLKSTLSTVASLITIWDKVEPLLRVAFKL